MADCRAGARKVQGIPEVSFFIRKYGVLKKMMEAWHKDTEASPKPVPTARLSGII